MLERDTQIRTAGAWMAIASALFAGVLIGHGPIDPDLSRQMEAIANSSVRWAIVHWAAAAALSLFAVAGLIVLTARSRLTQEWWTLSAWGVVTIGALWTVTTAVAEATVVAGAAAAGDAEQFEAWLAFSEGKANGFMFLALAVAFIAGNEGKSADPATPAWAAWIAVLAGTASFVAWPLGMWFGVRLGNILWVVSSLVMSLWILWFGFSLVRSKPR
jgi:hypothetical protein